MSKRNFFKRVCVAVLICIAVFVLSACATKLSGTYTSEGLIKQSFTFEEDNIVSVSAFGIDVEGTYTIEDDRIIITYGLLGLTYDFEKSFKKEGDSIFIDGTRFVKEK